MVQKNTKYVTTSVEFNLLNITCGIVILRRDTCFIAYIIFRVNSIHFIVIECISLKSRCRLQAHSGLYSFYFSVVVQIHPGQRQRCCIGWNSTVRCARQHQPHHVVNERHSSELGTSG